MTTAPQHATAWWALVQLFLLSSHAAWRAAAITVVTSAVELQAAITLGETTVALGSDVSLNATIQIKRSNITIDGYGYALDGRGLVRCLAVEGGSSVVLLNITLTRGFADKGGGLLVSGNSTVNASWVQVHNNSAALYGGAVYVEDSFVYFDRCSLEDNQASDSGGGFYISDGTASLSQCNVSQNEAGDFGGGFYSYNGMASLSECSVSHNEAGINGGGLYIFYGTASLTECSVSYNEAGYDGGGLYSYHGTALLSQCNVLHNEAGQNGGGFYSNYGTASLSQCSVSHNEADFYGGGLHLYYGTASLTECSVSHNNAGKSGGGLNIDHSTVSLSQCNVSHNEAGSNGGGLEIYYCTVSLTECSVSGNEASYSGGGFYCDHSTASLSECSVLKNEAGYYGGGLYINYGTASLSASSVSQSEARKGGGLYVNYAHASLFECSVSNNEASNDEGGGLYIFLGTVSLTECSVSHNEASHYGGGFYSYIGTVSLIQCSVSHNEAGYSGGGLDIFYGTASLSECSVSHNEAGYDGGGFYSYHGKALLSYCSVSHNEAGNNGGGFNSYYGTASLSECSVSENEAGYSGGGLKFDHCTVSLSQCNMSHNKAIIPHSWQGAKGGGLNIYDGTASLSQCIVSHNKAYLQGGGIYIEKGTVSFSECNVSHNVGGYGGGIYSFYCTASLSECCVSHNAAEYGNSNGEGGGLYIFGSTASLTKCSVSHNEADDRGGGLYSDSLVASFSECSLSYNGAGSEGGGLLLFKGAASFSECNVTHNEARRSGSGGGLSVKGQEFTASFSKCNILENKADRGGGMYVAFVKAVSLSMCNVASNTALSSVGGGIAVFSCTVLNLQSCNVTSNVVKGSNGGGLFLSGQTTANLTDSLIAGNSASPPKLFMNLTAGDCTAGEQCFYSPNYPDDYPSSIVCTMELLANVVFESVSFKTEAGIDVLTIGGDVSVATSSFSGTVGISNLPVNSGMYIHFRTDGTLSSSGFEICSVTNGGGLYVESEDAKLLLLRTTVQGNKASYNGGGIALASGATLVVKDGLVTDNAAYRYGGGLYVESSTVILDGTMVSGNNVFTSSSSTDGGQALYLEYGVLQGIDVVIDGNVAGPLASTSATCTSTCLPGAYGSSCSVVSGAPNCLSNCGVCYLCPVGRASLTAGATSIDDCILCATGQAAISAGSTSCVSCEPGTFAARNASDFGGGLTSQTLSGATICNPCPGGYYSSVTSSIVCSSCPGNTYTAPGSSKCYTCVRGFYLSAEGSCEQCPLDGSKCHTNGNATQTRLPLRQGWWRIDNMSLILIKCPNADACAGGAEFGPSGDGYCSPGFGGPLCAVCADNFYLDPASLSCESCSGSKDGVSSALIIVYIFAATLLFGGLAFFGKKRFITRHDEFRQRAQLASDRMNRFVDNLKLAYVTKGGGHYDDKMEQHDDGSVSFSRATSHFVQESKRSSVVVVNTNAAKITTTTTEVTEPHQRRVEVNTTLKSSSPTKSLFDVFRKLQVKFKVLAAGFQIAANIGFNTSVTYPAVFDKVLQCLSVFNLDIVPFLKLQCHAKFDYLDKMFAVTTVPIAVAACIVLLYAIILLNARNTKGKSGTPAGQNIVIIFCLWTFLVLVNASTALFNFYHCKEFTLSTGETVSFLVRDYSVRCYSKRWHNVNFFVLVMLMVYPIGIPSLYAALIWKHRRVLADVEEMNLEKASNYPRVGHLKFLFDSYQPQFFFFEVIECARRLMLASVLGVFNADSAVSPVLGILVSSAFSVVFLQYKPFKASGDSKLATNLSLSLTLLFFAALMIKVNITSDSANEQFFFGFILLIILGSGPVVALEDLVEPVLTSCVLIARNHLMIERRKDTADINGVELHNMKSNPIFRPSVHGKGQEQPGGATFNKAAQSAADFLPPASQQRRQIDSVVDRERRDPFAI